MVESPAQFDEIACRFRELAALALDESRADRWPWSSATEVTDSAGAAQYLRQHLDLFRLARVDLAGASVCEAGTGFGLALLLCKLLGATRAEGLEFVDEAVDAVRQYLESIPDDVARGIDVRRGDAAAMPYRDGEFDVLLSIEAISHYLDVPAFIGEAARVLRRGGVLIISDGNNGSNPIVAKKTREIWAAFETGPSGVKIHGHTVREAYRDMRARGLLAAFPELGDNARVLADRTAGMTYTEIHAAAERFVGHGELPDRPYRRGTLAISPAGMAMERLFKPRVLARELERQGFRAQAYGYWGGASGRRDLRLANRVLTALTPISLFTAPAFRIVARRL